MSGSATTGSPGSPIPPLAVSQIELQCTDLEAAHAFYCGGLGFRLIGKIDDALLVDAGSIVLLICRVLRPRSGTTLYLNANDRIHAIAFALAARGIYFKLPPRCVVRNDYGNDVWIAHFSDPWGNPLALLSNMPTGYARES